MDLSLVTSDMAAVASTAKAYVPLGLGLMGLGTGYLIYGPQELFKFPARDQKVDRAMGVWGIWMPGFCQIVAGVTILLGLSLWPNLSGPGTATGLYAVGVAMSAFGIHWLALGWNRYQGNDSRPNAGMSVAFMVLCALAAAVLFQADAGLPSGKDWVGGILFILLFLVYLADFFLAIGVKVAEKALGLFHLISAVWIMYMMVAFVLDQSLGANWHV